MVCNVVSCCITLYQSVRIATAATFQHGLTSDAATLTKHGRIHHRRWGLTKYRSNEEPITGRGGG